MRKTLKKDIYESRFTAGEFRQAVTNVENGKRRRALPHFATDFQFFERVLAMKRLEDFVFITKTAARNR